VADQELTIETTDPNPLLNIARAMEGLAGSTAVLAKACAFTRTVEAAVGLEVHEFSRDGVEVGDVTLSFATREQAHAFWRVANALIPARPNASIEQFLSALPKV
jgi:hypothetical protein